MNIPSRIGLAGATLALTVAPGVAFAHGVPQSTAAKQCAQERSEIGKTLFASTYGTNKNGSNAFGKCVSQHARQNAADQRSAQGSAEKSCRSQQDDPSFASDHSGKTFDQFYGTGKKDRNAFGKCVSSTAKTMSDHAQTDQTQAEVNAARTCRSERSADPSAFKAKFATGKNKSNAFGKCVSTTAKAREYNTNSSS